jgi:PhnB protein
MGERKPVVKTEVIPYLFYRDVPAALGWLARAFGFIEVLRHPTPHGMHAEMTLDGQFIMMGQGSEDWRMQSPSGTKVATMGVFIYLADVDSHYERARGAGAEIVKAPHDEPYGRTYTARVSMGIRGSSLRRHAELVFSLSPSEMLRAEAGGI